MRAGESGIHRALHGSALSGSCCMKGGGPEAVLASAGPVKDCEQYIRWRLDIWGTAHIVMQSQKHI